MINDQACKKDHLRAEMGLFPSAELVNFFSVVVMGQVERKIKLLILGYTFFDCKVIEYLDLFHSFYSTA